MAQKRLKKAGASDDGGDDDRQGVPVFVRLSEKMMKSPPVERAVSELNRKAFFERLLEAFIKSSELEQNAVLGRQDALHAVGNQLAEASWSAHAFSLEHWPWAVSCYRRIADDAAKFGAKELLAFALYREGYAWNELGLGLRRHALANIDNRDRNLWGRDYDAAIDSIKRGLACTEEMPDLASVPKFYNLACGHAHLAQMSVERALRLDGDWTEKLSRSVREEVPTDPWEEIGSAWRGLMNKGEKERSKQFHSPVSVEDVDKHLDLSLKFLSDTSERAADHEASFPVPWPDPEFFKRVAYRDSDLVFLRADSVAKQRYATWSGTTPPEDHDEWLFRSYQNLLSSISSKGNQR